MPRPSATTLLLLGVAALRAAAATPALTGPDRDPFAVLLLVEVLVALVAALADLRRHRAAPTAAVAIGALGAGQLLVTGLTAQHRPVPMDATVLLALGAAVLALLAAAAAIGRWQDHGAPLPGGGRRPLRVLTITAGAVVALLLVTADVAVLGAITVGGGTLPGPVGLATTVDVARIPLLLAALLPLAWSATRGDTTHLVAVGLVVGARGAVEAVLDATLVGLGTPLWPSVAGGVASGVLLVVVPALRQVTSSRA